MAIIKYQKVYNRAEALENFLDLSYSYQLKYFASDLLNEGLSPEDIHQAIQRAISIGKSSNLNIRRHFLPIYTQAEHQVIRDCKLSRLGYALVLLNANPEIPVVGEWQLKVLNRFFEK